MVEALAAGFGSSDEVPAFVPDLDPGVIAILVGPVGNTSQASGNTDGPTGVCEQDG